MAIRELSAHDMTIMLAATARTREHARDRAILVLCLDAGLRRGEIAGLRVGDFDPLTSVLTVAEGVRRRLVRLGSTSCAALAPFITDRVGASPLLIARSGRRSSERTVHEQLRRIGELAGLGEWVTNRHTRRGFIGLVAMLHSAPVAMRLIGHLGGRVRPASCEEALEAQQVEGWVSPMDGMLGGRWASEGSRLTRALYVTNRADPRRRGRSRADRPESSSWVS